MSGLATAMVMPFVHAPVLRDEVVELLGRAPRPGWLVDATVGGGGHASALLEAHADLRLIGVDRDPEAVAASRARLAGFGDRVRVLHGNFSQLPALLAEQGVAPVSGIIADLGVSSFQLDSAGRGFSFRARGPLDMRMDPSRGPTARELLSELSERELAVAIKQLGEERYAKRVARAIKAADPVDTEALANVIRLAQPRSQQRIHPATRTFQAIRMLLNDELGELRALLAALPDLLVEGGVAAIISFHSLEDRAVKRALRAAANPCVCPQGLPVCVCGKQPTFALLTRRPLRPSDPEIAQNPRARSAKMRAAERLPRRVEV